MLRCTNVKKILKYENITNLGKKIELGIKK